MNRRDFIKLTAAGAAIVVLPVSLTAPAIGGDWTELYVGSWFIDPAMKNALRRESRFAFSRTMTERGYTEIRDFKERVTWHGHGAWFMLTTAQAR